MTKVFIGGSRQLSRLNADVKRRIDTIIEKDFTILVGDANGADKAVQRYLSSRNYSNVVVFCMEEGRFDPVALRRIDRELQDMERSSSLNGKVDTVPLF